MKNRFLEKYRAGGKSLGTFTHLLSAPAVEALARAGLDYVIIDIEHSPIGAEHAAELISTASGAGLAPFVRIDEISRSPVLKMLDAGAAGLIVPQLESVEQAEKLVSWAKFAPLGNRGYCPGASTTITRRACPATWPGPTRTPCSYPSARPPAALSI